MDIPTTILVLILLILPYSSLSLASDIPTHNVQSLGAAADGSSSSSGAFLLAWELACAAVEPATIYVPPGKYMLGYTVFDGCRCKNRAITILVDGTLVAPSNYEDMGSSGTWLTFVRVNGVSIAGGRLDGRGRRLWACKRDSGTGSCPQGTMSLAFYDSNNINVDGLDSYNPELFHILVDGCQNVELTNMRIRAPADSPNTDGIHVSRSSEVTITNSHISTGDDCISIGPGASNLVIHGLICGSGHGISIGSLGWVVHEAGVRNVTVKWVKFKGTQNGVRIKTWARYSRGSVRHVLFDHMVMDSVHNPIIIDQNYCPHGGNCPTEGSGVRIRDVTYRDIKGTSATQVAVKLSCSEIYPCKRIHFDDVYLTYGSNEPAVACCENALGNDYGYVYPSGCF